MTNRTFASWSVTLLVLMITATSVTASARLGTKFPYNGKKTDDLVGAFGGTGCSRHWDFMDLNDSSLEKPYDRCGAYLMVSGIHHKWIDSRIYPPGTLWWDIHPVEGDGVLTLAKCSYVLGHAVYALEQHAQCGGPAKPLVYCDEKGKEVPAEIADLCVEPAR